MCAPLLKVVLYLSSTSNHNAAAGNIVAQTVVLYLSSTSNHNTPRYAEYKHNVVLYLSSTSNHNARAFAVEGTVVVLYLSSTSNHNGSNLLGGIMKLCYIFLLHQTTTYVLLLLSCTSCVISFFYIKPQLLLHGPIALTGCVISFFYIKPQLPRALFLMTF